MATTTTGYAIRLPLSGSPMHLTILLRGLLDVPPEPARPWLAKLLGGAALRFEADGAGAALAPLYGVARDQDWPLAPLRVAARGIATGSAYWLAATPVWLLAGRDDVRIGGTITDLDAPSAAALTAALDAHFAGDGLAFIAPEPGQWFVAVEHVPALSTRPVAVVLDQPLRNHLASGADAPLWRRWEQEIQMLLHAHPVNEVRERQDRVPVNGLWFHEGGRFPSSRTADRIASWGDDEYLRALAHHCGRPARPLAATVAAMLGEDDADRHVAALDASSLDAVTVDAFLRGAYEALCGGRLQSVEVIADGRGLAAARWHCVRPGLVARLFPPRTPSHGDLIASARGGT